MITLTLGKYLFIFATLLFVKGMVDASKLGDSEQSDVLPNPGKLLEIRFNLQSAIFFFVGALLL